MKTTEFKFQLDQSSKKFRCPGCGKKRFVKFIDVESGNYLDTKYGRCDREVKCGYYLNPYQDENFESATDCKHAKYPSEPDFIPYEIFDATLKRYTGNKFVQYLKTIFDAAKVANLIDLYHIGTSNHWPGSTIFWQIDRKENIRTGKVMLYDHQGYRVKKPFNHIQWVHALLFHKFNLKQCLYGEHLLKDIDKPVAVVESEKTAIIAAGFYPEFLWLATGALHNLKPETCNSLIGRDVTLFPDLGAHKKWQQKTNEISYFCSVVVSNILEDYAPAEDRKKGYDLADYLTEPNTENTPNDNHCAILDKPSMDKYRSENMGNAGKKINNRDYPASWDIEPPEAGTIEYYESTMAAINDAHITKTKRDKLFTKLFKNPGMFLQIGQRYFK